MERRNSPNGGRLILLVGPSGVGKDTLLREALTRRVGPPLHIVWRAITRPADDGPEDHEPITRDVFEARRANGAFFLSWTAHGHGYGTPADTRARLARGDDLVLNASRRVLGQAAELWPATAVISVEASAATLERRLKARGREDAAAIAARRARAAPRPPTGLDVVTVMNDGPLERGVADMIAALDQALDRARRRGEG